jgi:predicted Zn-dependent peptidase
MEHKSSEFYQEEYFVEKLDNGLTVIYYPKNDFCTTEAFLSSYYGSLQLDFIPIGEKEVYHSPSGVAHFLEHKMFEMSKGEDATNLFANLGCEANAFTTYDHTSYYFSGVDYIEEGICLLLDFCQNHDFTKSAIQKERGIIQEELKMYMDEESSMLHNGLLSTLYSKNNVRLDIGGTLDSIQKIDGNVLQKCYETFYHPSNLTLTIVGKMNVERLHEVICQNQQKKSFPKGAKPITFMELDDKEILHPITKQTLSIREPRLAVGMKFGVEGLSIGKIMKRSLALDMLMDIMFDSASDNYQKWKEEGLVDNSFDYSSYYETTYAYCALASNTKDPETLIKVFTKALLEMKEKEISQTIFTRYKKLSLANILRRLGNLDYIANLITELSQINISFFDYLTMNEEITLDDLKEMASLIDEKKIGVHVLMPKEKNQ